MVTTSFHVACNGDRQPIGELFSLGHCPFLIPFTEQQTSLSSHLGRMDGAENTRAWGVSESMVSFP